MRILISIFLAATVICHGCSKEVKYKSVIVPQPSRIIYDKGEFFISEETQIHISDPELIPLAELLQKNIRILSNLDIEISSGDNSKKSIKLVLKDGFPPEGYELIISDEIRIVASNYNAVAAGLSSVMQLMNPAKKGIKLQKVTISDQPDFEYRSVMLDLARFWNPVETIKETIDLLWFYKIRYLHLHLSDNERFTFPLDEFPDLKIVKEDGTREYYTIDELNDLVEYARQRGIVIIPEIDLPGHSSWLWKKYPEVFGSIDPITGKAKNLYVVNMAKEEMYHACEKMINKLAEVFYTSPYIHFGGDEIYLEAMKSIPEYKTFCKKHNLNVAFQGDADELFCYFINRINEMVKAAGKQSIIWEGFHGKGCGNQNISKDIQIIVWNTTYNHPDSLLKNGYKIINATWIPWYMVGAMNLAAPQEKGYNWDVTKWAHWNERIKNIELDSKTGILGGQICFWEQNHYKVIPILQERVPVLAERLWSNTSTTDFEGFQSRFVQTNSLFNRLFNPVKIEVSDLLSEQDQTFSETALITLKSGIHGTIKYLYSDSWKLPEVGTGFVYKKPFTIEKSGVLSVQLFDENGEQIGFPVQQYYQKIVPAYHYKVYGGAPQNGWTEMPDFAQLIVVREGVAGLMTPERIEKINGELFAKVKKGGHIETRFPGIYNPYAVELKGNIDIPKSDLYVFRIQTYDGLAELYIDYKLVGKEVKFENKPEDFSVILEAGTHKITIKYYYKQIQNQLSILYRTKEMQDFEPFENLVQPIK